MSRRRVGTTSHQPPERVPPDVKVDQEISDFVAARRKAINAARAMIAIGEANIKIGKEILKTLGVDS